MTYNKTSKDTKRIGDYLGVSYKHIKRTCKGLDNIITYKGSIKDQHLGVLQKHIERTYKGPGTIITYER